MNSLVYDIVRYLGATIIAGLPHPRSISRYRLIDKNPKCVLHRLQRLATIILETFLYNSAIDNVLTNLLPAGLLVFFQFHHFLLNHLKYCISIVSRKFSFIILSASHFLKLPTHKLMLYHHLLMDAFSYTTSAMTSQRILITVEYFNAHFFLSSYLSVCYKTV